MRKRNSVLHFRATLDVVCGAKLERLLLRSEGGWLADPGAQSVSLHLPLSTVFGRSWPRADPAVGVRELHPEAGPGLVSRFVEVVGHRLQDLADGILEVVVELGLMQGSAERFAVDEAAHLFDESLAADEPWQPVDRVLQQLSVVLDVIVLYLALDQLWV